MQTLVTAIHVMTCILLVLVVLIQAGKGAEISTSLGGSSQTVFGTSGGANFLTRFTSVAAVIFMITSVTLTLMSSQSRKSLFEGVAPPPAAQPPASSPATQGSPAGSAEAKKPGESKAQ